MPTGNQADDVAAIVTAVSARMDLTSAATFVGACGAVWAGVATAAPAPTARAPAAMTAATVVFLSIS